MTKKKFGKKEPILGKSRFDCQGSNTQPHNYQVDAQPIN